MIDFRDLRGGRGQLADRAHLHLRWQIWQNEPNYVSEDTEFIDTIGHPPRAERRSADGVIFCLKM